MQACLKVQRKQKLRVCAFSINLLALTHGYRVMQKKRKKEIPFAGSLPNCLQWLGLSQTAARGPGMPPRSSRKYSRHPLLPFPSTSAISQNCNWLSNGIQVSQAVAAAPQYLPQDSFHSLSMTSLKLSVF